MKKSHRQHSVPNQEPFKILLRLFFTLDYVCLCVCSLVSGIFNMTELLGGGIPTLVRYYYSLRLSLNSCVPLVPSPAPPDIVLCLLSLPQQPNPHPLI